MRMSKTQIAKLTPAQRKAREARLEYNRRYDAAKKKGVKHVAKQSVPKSAKVKHDAIEVLKSRLAQANALIDTIETLESQLADTQAALSKLI